MPLLSLNLQRATRNTPLPSRTQFKRWVQAAIRVDTEVTIRVVDREEGIALNHAYRDKAYATNVLTFPLADTPHLMGDIILCDPVIREEAQAQGKALMHHYAHLTVHGILHLHGYDHEVVAQADLMEAMEVAILQQLKIANPYLE